MKYTIVIPAKNEASGIRETLNSVVTQTILPLKCIVIDDGSTDETSKIIKEFENKYSFIKYHLNTQERSSSYSLGGHVVNLFNIGRNELAKIGCSSDYIIKMDADISFEPDFISKISECIAQTEKLGIISGTPYYYENSNKKYEYSPDWHTHGQFKIYYTACLDHIGGLKSSLGWDTADNISAIAQGWKTIAFRDINYKMSRKVGGKSSLSKGRINHGIGSYILGYNIFYLFLKAFHDIFKAPYIVGSFNLLKGYLQAITKGYNRILSDEEVLILRRLLWKSFFKRFVNKDFIIFQHIKKKHR